MDFIQKLRDNALYIKLEAEKKFGGAVDISTLTKALNSLNQSFESYFEAEAKNQIDKKITKSVDNEIGKLNKESRLLIVDLDFSSFAAGVTPNLVTISNDYASIRKPLELKRKVFDGYKTDVFFGDYSDEAFLKRINKKFAPDERVQIFKPLFDNIFNQKKFRFYFGESKKNLKQSVKGVSRVTVDNIIPKEAKIPSEVEKLYKVYITASGDFDLFGQKAKVKKYLATEELKYPTYPYQVKEIFWDDKLIILNSPISADVSFDEASGVFKIIFSDLNIVVWGRTREESEEAFQMAFASIVQNFYSEDDKRLTNKAIEIKEKLAKLVYQIKDI